MYISPILIISFHNAIITVISSLQSLTNTEDNCNNSGINCASLLAGNPSVIRARERTLLHFLCQSISNSRENIVTFSVPIYQSTIKMNDVFLKKLNNILALITDGFLWVI